MLYNTTTYLQTKIALVHSEHLKYICWLAQQKAEMWWEKNIESALV